MDKRKDKNIIINTCNKIHNIFFKISKYLIIEFKQDNIKTVPLRLTIYLRYYKNTLHKNAIFKNLVL